VRIQICLEERTRHLEILDEEKTLQGGKTLSSRQKRRSGKTRFLSQSSGRGMRREGENPKLSTDMRFPDLSGKE